MIAGIETDGRAVARRLQRVHPRFQRQRTTDGAPWECCLRGRLAEALSALGAQTGLELKSAFELEFLGQLSMSPYWLELPVSIR